MHPGLGRSKFLPKPMPPEINNIMDAAASGGDAASPSHSHEARCNDATETTSSAEMMSLKCGGGGCSAATMSSMETLDDEDDDDGRNG